MTYPCLFWHLPLIIHDEVPCSSSLNILFLLPSDKGNPEYPVIFWCSSDLDVNGKGTISILEKGAIGFFAREAIDVHISLSSFLVDF